MPELKVHHQKFLVRALACFQSPAHVVHLLEQEFELTVPLRQVLNYHPEHSEEVPARWVRFFRAEREKFLFKTGDRGVSHDSFLLQVLQQLLDRETLKPHPDPLLVMQLVKLSAQIRGGAFRKQSTDEEKPAIPPNIEAAIRRVYGADEPDEAKKPRKSPRQTSGNSPITPPNPG